MFITFEGIDGSGKSTQIKRLQQQLEEQGGAVEVYRDPGGPPVSEEIRQILLDPDYEIDPITELLLFSAARSQLVAENILPALQQGNVVILDRFYDSTVAYQGYGRASVSLEEIDKINALASHHRKPDLTIYMRVPLEEAKKRMEGQQKDRMEQSGDPFYKKVIEGFDKLAGQEDRFITIDATQPSDQVHQQIWKKVERLFSS